jgi:3',5'-cyclic AMP phosphodiesterase CpdA
MKTTITLTFFALCCLLIQAQDLPRFAVISDTHFENNIGEGAAVKVPRALKNLLWKHPQPDAIFVVGDITHRGRPEQYAQLLSVFGDSTNVPKGTAVYFMMGFQHDRSGSIHQENYLLGTHQPLHQYINIKGYPFITISEGGRHPSEYNESVKAWLSEKLEDAAKNYPDKPIFVFTHIPPLSTCYGSGPGGWGTDMFSEILNKYPQIVIFSGHSHYPIGDPRSIHQGIFTAVNTGSTSDSSVAKGILVKGEEPPFNELVTEGLLVDVLSNGNIEIERWDTYRNEEILPRWLVQAPHDGTKFTYTDNRDGLPAPVFSPDAKPKVTFEKDSCLVSFAQATDNEVVQHYLIEIIDGTKVIASNKVFSLFYLNSQMPGTLSAKFGGLPSGKNLKARIVAFDPYGNTSLPIQSKTFKVK